MMARVACLGLVLLCSWRGQARAMTMAEVEAEARNLLAQPKPRDRIDEDRTVALAFHLAGGCPATVDGERDPKLREERKETIAALIGLVAEAGSKRGLTKLLQLSKCGIESPDWGRERILEQAMARMMAFVPCTPPLPGEVAAARDELADFPILRLRKGALHAELPTKHELDDLAYFMVAVAQAGEEVGGARDEAGTWPNRAPPSARREELFQELAVAKSAGRVLDIERLARGYLETLNFPDTLHGAEEDVFFELTPRYQHVMRDLAESWEALGRFHEAAGLWRRDDRASVGCGVGESFRWQQQVKAVIRDEEIEGRCEAAVAERLLDVGGSPWDRTDPYGPKRLADAGFDVARLFRGAVLTINRDAGEAAVGNAIDALPPTARLFARMRLRDKGVEDWERRLEASRGLADTMKEAAIPLLLRVAEDSRPAGRQGAILALGDLLIRTPYDPCRVAGGASEGSSAWVRPIQPIGQVCPSRPGMVARERVAKAIAIYAKDGDGATRVAVAVALGRLAVPTGIPTLRRMLDDKVMAVPARAALDHITEVERNWRPSK